MESDVHMNYVRVLRDYIIKKFPKSEWSFMNIDLPESTSHPYKIINGYRPDIYVSGLHCIIIGEAKTLGDTKNRHTREQIKSHVKELNTFSKERHLM